MDVTGITVAKAQQIEDSSIVSIYVNASGGIVSVNGADVETLAGTLNFEYVQGEILASDVFSASDLSTGPLYRIATFDTLPADDAFFAYHTDGITVKNTGVYRFHGELICNQDVNVTAVGLRVSEFGGAGNTFDTAGNLRNPPANIGLLDYRMDVTFEHEVSVANTRFYLSPFINKTNTDPLPSWAAMLRISQAGPIVTPP